jgi:CheY-like chemotaxis protein
VNSDFKKILIADDDRTALMLMEAALRVAGFTVAAAADGEQAMALFRKEPFDLVMLDIEMPGLSGLEVCGQIRREAGDLLPIVMVTGMDDVASATCCAATRSTSTCRPRARATASSRITTASPAHRTASTSS